jgi:hypothetical protein
LSGYDARSRLLVLGGHGMVSAGVPCKSARDTHPPKEESLCLLWTCVGTLVHLTSQTRSVSRTETGARVLVYMLLDVTRQFGYG